jgi:AcrR family transcriptional regulator
MPVQGKTKHDIVWEFRNAEILEAARKVFGERGYNEAPVEAIARAAGLAKGTLYLYYRSKSEIYWAALRNGLMALAEEIRCNVQAAGTIEAKIRAFMETKITYFDRNHDFFRIYYAEAGNVVKHPAYSHEHFQDLYLQQMSVLMGALKQAMKRKTIRKVRAEAAAFAILDITRGAILHRLLGWSKTSIQEDVSSLFDLIWKGLAAR